MLAFKRIFITLISIMIVSSLSFIIILNNTTLSESLLHLNEYQQVELRNQLITYMPYVWGLFSLIGLGILMSIFFKTKNKWLLLTFPLPFLIVFLMGTVTSTLPLDTFILKNGSSLEKEITKLQKRHTLQSEDLKIYDFDIHFKNIPLQSGTYMVTRVANPTTELQDEYWYHPLNPIHKWKKANNPRIDQQHDPIAVKDINWQLVPDMLADTNKRLQKKQTYYPGVNMILLIYRNNHWEWNLSIVDIRGHHIGDITYDLDGNFLDDSAP